MILIVRAMGWGFVVVVMGHAERVLKIQRFARAEIRRREISAMGILQ
jgi:hypothetical protein